MSIPTPFNPMGTLGADGIVRRGLLYYVDSYAEPSGQIEHVTNLADGSLRYFNAPTSNSAAGIYFTSSINLELRQGLELSDDVHVEVVLKGNIIIPALGTPGFGGGVVAVYPWPGGSRGVSQYNWHTSTFNVDNYLSFSTAPSKNYLNGSPIEHIIDSHTFFSVPSAPTKIQCYQGLDCRLLAVRVYNGELSAAEVRKNFEFDKRRYNLS